MDSAEEPALCALEKKKKLAAATGTRDSINGEAAIFRRDHVDPSMIQTLKKQWHLFLRSTPGHRFQDVRKRRKAKSGASSPVRKHGMMIVGIVICLLGVAALPLPGPGTLVLAGGLMILAAESMAVARVLDRADEVRARLMSKMGRVCKKMGATKCVLLAACAVVLFIGAAVALWVSFT